MFSKPIFKTHPQNIVVDIDNGVDTIILSCDADGFPHPVITWLENNSTVVNKTAIVIQNGSLSKLVVVVLKTKEVSKYRCMARNSLGITLSKEATLTVLRRTTRSPTKGSFVSLAQSFPKNCERLIHREVYKSIRP